MAQGNIAQYTSPIDQIHPSEVGADALAQAGRHIGAEYREAGQEYQGAIDHAAGPVAKIVDQHETFADISQGAHTLAALTNNLQTQWNDTVAKSDPNDKSIQATFLNNTLEPQLEGFQSAFTTDKGQEWGLSSADRLREHFNTTTAADMSVRAGDAVLLNTVGQINQLKSSAYKDPSSTDVALSQVDSYYEAAKENNSGLLNAKEIAHMDTARMDAKNEIVKNAIKGYADAGHSDAATKLLDSGNYDEFLPKEEQSALRTYIDNHVNAQQVEQQQKQQQQQQQQTAANQQEVKGIFSQISSGQGYLATTAFANTKLSTQQKNDFVAQKNGILSLPQDFLTSPAYGDGFSQASRAVYSGQPITAAALTMGVRRQEITPAGAVQLQQIGDKMKTADGLAEVNAQNSVLQQMKAQIIKGGPNANDPAGQKIYNNMLNSFYPAWDAAIKSGKSPAELADPNSKDYIGNLANTFKRSDTQALADVTAATPAAAPKITVPALDQRKIGTVYPTPRGDMTWNGNGWIPAKKE